MGRRAADHRLSTSGRLAAAGGTEVFVHEWGEPQAPAVLYWHGLGGTGLDAEEAALALAGDHGFRVLAPDVPGLGRSPALAGRPLDALVVAGLTAPLLDTLGVERCVLVGHSWGGGVACRAAAARPERAAALVLLDGGFLDPEDWPRRRVRRSVSVAHWAGVARSDGITGPEAWAQAVHAHLREEPVSATYQTIASARVPVLLLLAGSYDPSFRRGRERAVLRFRSALPDADVHIVDAVGHDLPREAGAEVGRMLGGWLRPYRASRGWIDGSTPA